MDLLLPLGKPHKIPTASGFDDAAEIAPGTAESVRCALLLDDASESDEFEICPSTSIRHQQAGHRDWDVLLGLTDFVGAFEAVTFSMLDKQNAEVRFSGDPRNSPLGVEDAQPDSPAAPNAA